MLTPTHPAYDLVKDGAAATREMDDFYNTHCDELTPELEQRAWEREKAVFDAIDTLLHSMPAHTPEELAQGIETLSTPPSGRPEFLLFAHAMRRAVAGQMIGRFL
ncbi:hypothetical protein CKO28_08915 [Rhodovibrio sodomensis]|uniref:CdiI immunity protein domain-containing protein n=1 Tax=Rhodovibrio sodomensis TaxID=1088 RepID=A0ABS1DDW5_9PROT|nr:hypothetical protein [Rhodovibrio sodomensis]MBK1668156.1 hypothetical protein [Rhodovibrio sodomensis]